MIPGGITEPETSEKETMGGAPPDTWNVVENPSVNTAVVTFGHAMNGGGNMVKEQDGENPTAPDESWTRRVKTAVPFVVGFPEMSPDAALRTKPKADKSPEAREIVLEPADPPP